MCASHCVCTLGTYGCVQQDVGMLVRVYALESVDVSVWVCSSKLGGRVGSSRKAGHVKKSEIGGHREEERQTLVRSWNDNGKGR